MYGTPPALQAFRSGFDCKQLTTAKQALDVYTAVKRKHPELDLSKEFVNEWGYTLARQGIPQQAVELFKLNVGLHPNSWNSYDSLGEAYEMAGNSALAITNYKQALALNPRNTGAVEHLKKLTGISK